MRLWERATRVPSLLWLFAACARDEPAALVVGEPPDESAPSEVPDAEGQGANLRGVGAVCVNESESDPQFSGFGVTELNIVTRSAACDSNVCVTRGFQGRVTCPYGQSAGRGGCLLPGSDDPVEVPVDPQLVERPPELASFCSCRCAGGRGGPYCNCPESMECTLVYPDLGRATAEEAGSYCVPRDSPAWDGASRRAACDRSLANCEDRGRPTPRN